MKPHLVRAAIVSTLTAALLVGCAPAASDTAEPEINPAVVEQIAYTTTDGRHITCLIIDSGYQGGIDCDWENN